MSTITFWVFEAAQLERALDRAQLGEAERRSIAGFLGGAATERLRIEIETGEVAGVLGVDGVRRGASS